MKSLLPWALGDVVRVGGREYKIRPTALRVLAAVDALQDEDLTPAHRVELATRLLYRWPRPRASTEAVDAALALLREPSPYRSVGPDRQTLDLEQDAAMIAAAFLQQYGLRLPRDLAVLDWREFLALLGGITDDTRLGQIEGYRTMDLPKWTPHNGEQRRAIQRQKAIYAIRSPRARGTSFDEGLRKMAIMLTEMAEAAEDEERHRPDAD